MRLALLLVIMYSTSVSAYDVETHMLLSTEALKASSLASTNILEKLGLRAELYNQAVQRFPNNDPNGENRDLSINDLIRFGAVLEDDIETERSIHHFYDPHYDRALDIPLLGLVRNPRRSPDWALEDLAELPGQEFSYRDAVEYYFLALTAQTEQERDINWGRLFQSLGHVIHHIQDMFQPQHVRNDDHCNLGNLQCFFRHDPSYYESYTAERISQTIPPNIILDYPVPEFPTVREYWTAPLNTGASDFTNRNFFSKDTNFRYHNGQIAPNAEYPNPVPDLTPVPRNIADPDLLGAQGQALCNELKAAYKLHNPPAGDCFIDFIQTAVIDALHPERAGQNPKAASLSIFDDELTRYNLTYEYIGDYGDLITIDRKPTLNRFNFDAAHSYLIPRAVSYGAGIIDNFFAERFSVTVDHENRKYRLKNISGDTLYGAFYLYGETLDAAENWRQITTWSIPASGIQNGAELVVDIPDLKAYKVDLRIVYRGNAGADALVEAIDAKPVQVRYEITGYESYEEIEHNRESRVMKTYHHHNYNSYEFKIEYFVETNGTTRYQYTNNFYSSIRTADYVCIIEVPGFREIQDSDNFAFYYSLIGGLSYHGGTRPIPGTNPPTESDCADAGFGYRSTSWSDGWISKFPPNSKTIMYFSLYARWDDLPALIRLTPSNFYIYNDNTSVCDQLTSITQINSSWNNQDIFGMHQYWSIDEYLSDNPIGYLDLFIPNELNDYRCR